MASTNKTPQLGLNQWAAGDPVLREEFNADNAKLDAAVAAAPGLAHASGRYQGTGLEGSPTSVNVGFHPSVVLIYWIDGYDYPSVLCLKGKGINQGPQYPLAITTDTGFTVSHFVDSGSHAPLRPCLNEGRQYFYIAFR